jgi:uncharacterized protein YqhQ
MSVFHDARSSARWKPPVATSGQRLPRLARVVLLPGLGLQRLTTREPRLDETRVALTALAAVLRRELAHG